jgi:hypothetical protein
LTTSSFGAFQTDWLAPMLTLLLLVAAVLRLVTVLLQTADAAGRFEQASRTTLAVVRALALPGRSLQALSARGVPWSGVLHPFAFALALCSAGLAWLMSSVPGLAEWSGRAAWVLLAGALGFAASAGVVSLWPPSPAGMRRPRNTRDRVAGQLTAAAGPVTQPDGWLEPPPADFAEVTRRALRALNKPATLAKSELIALLPRSLHEVWQQSGEVGPGDPSPLERSHALRTILVRAIEQLNVSDQATTRAHQYEVLRMQYVMGLSVVQVAMRLSIAEQGVYRRSAEGVEAVADDLWRREHLLAGRERSAAAAPH